MQIRYSTLPFLELEFLGSANDFKELALILSRGEGELVADNGIEPNFYTSFGSEIIVRRTVGENVAIALSRSKVSIAGDEKGLAVLAENLRGLGEEAQAPYHLHIEYFPDHPYLAPESFPLVCRLRE